jgi:LuxR family maltose regulon positive regulatory protein
MEHARRGLDLMAEDDHVGRGGVAALLGLAYWSVGDLQTAYRWYAEGMAGLERAGHLADVVGGSVTRAGIRLAQGRLTEALSIYQRGLALATQPGRPALRGAADMHVGISEILRERDDLEGARENLQASRQFGDENAMPQNAHRSRVAMARILEAEGDPDSALELLDEAERLYQSDFAPNLRPIAALRAKIWIAQGELSKAWGWAREHELAPTDDLAYLREYEHMILARLLNADSDGRPGDPSVRVALGLVQRLLDAAERGDRWRSVIEVLVLQALAHAHDRTGDPAPALASLDRAVELAEPEGYVRVFVDEGPPMARLLKQLARTSGGQAYVGRLLASFDGADQGRKQSLVEALSERELEVLRLLATDLPGPEIARELFVSLNTMRTHSRNIYAKLGVSSRRAAVRRADELDLLVSAPDR